MSNEHTIRVGGNESLTAQLLGHSPWFAECSCGWNRGTYTRSGADAAASEHRQSIGPDPLPRPGAEHAPKEKN